MFGTGTEIVITYRDEQYGTVHSIPLYIEYNVPTELGVGELVLRDYNTKSDSIN